MVSVDKIPLDIFINYTFLILQILYESIAACCLKHAGVLFCKFPEFIQWCSIFYLLGKKAGPVNMPHLFKLLGMDHQFLNSGLYWSQQHLHKYQLRAQKSNLRFERIKYCAIPLLYIFRYTHCKWIIYTFQHLYPLNR